MKTHLLPALLRLAGAALLATASAACSGTSGSAPSNPPAPAPAPVPAPAPAPVAAPVTAAAPAAGGLLQQIQAEVGSAACDSAQQCKTVAIGHKACGGPESYMAYSTKAGNGARIEQLAAALTAERKARDSASGRMSNCMLVADPGATCSAGRCVTGGPGLGGSSER